MGLVAVVMLAVGIPVAVAAVSGSLSIPHNDTWSYSLITKTFAETGEIKLLGWNRASLIGQVVMLGPFGRWISVQNSAVALLAAVTLLLVYRLLSQHIGRRLALIGTATVAAFPGFGLLATSYMTDIPGLFAVVVSLTVGDRAVRQRSPGLLALGLAFGVWGATIREQDLAVVVALGIVAARQWPEKRLALSSVLAALIAFGVFEVWRRHLAFGDPGSVGLSVHTLVWNTIAGVFTFGLLAAPIVAILTSGIRFTRLNLSAGALVILLGVGTLVHLHGQLFLGSYIGNTGAYAGGNDNGAPVIFPAGVMAILDIVGIASTAVLPAILSSRLRYLDPLLAWFAYVTVAGTGIEILAGQGVQDRYLIPLIIPMAALCRRGNSLEVDNDRTSSWASPVGGRVAISILVGLSCFSLVVTLNGLLRDGAQWKAAQAMITDGIPARQINAGFDWVGYHANEPAVVTTGLLTVFRKFAWKFPDSRSCVAVTMVPLAGLRPLTTSSFATYGVAGSSTVYTYRIHACRAEP